MKVERLRPVIYSELEKVEEQGSWSSKGVNVLRFVFQLISDDQAQGEAAYYYAVIRQREQQLNRIIHSIEIEYIAAAASQFNVSHKDQPNPVLQSFKNSIRNNSDETLERLAKFLALTHSLAKDKNSPFHSIEAIELLKKSSEVEVLNFVAQLKENSFLRLDTTFHDAALNILANGSETRIPRVESYLLFIGKCYPQLYTSGNISTLVQTSKEGSLSDYQSLLSVIAHSLPAISGLFAPPLLNQLFTIFEDKTKDLKSPEDYSSVLVDLTEVVGKLTDVDIPIELKQHGIRLLFKVLQRYHLNHEQIASVAGVFNDLNEKSNPENLEYRSDLLTLLQRNPGQIGGQRSKMLIARCLANNFAKSDSAPDGQFNQLFSSIWESFIGHVDQLKGDFSDILDVLLTSDVTKPITKKKLLSISDHERRRQLMHVLEVIPEDTQSAYITKLISESENDADFKLNMQSVAEFSGAILSEQSVVDGTHGFIARNKSDLATIIKCLIILEDLGFEDRLTPFNLEASIAAKIQEVYGANKKQMQSIKTPLMGMEKSTLLPLIFDELE